MKKLLVVLLSLGLIVAFAMTASAQPSVKFSGEYYVVGVYEDNRSLKETGGNSLANFWTLTRVQTVFGIAEGLTFTTRFDALEKMWGGINNSDVANWDRTNSRKPTATLMAYQEVIEFEQAYVTFATPIGQFQVGYQPAEVWGTGFANTPNSRARVLFAAPIGPVTIAAVYEKHYDSVSTTAATNNFAFTNADVDKYMLNAVFKFKGGDTGLLYVYTDAGYYGSNDAAYATVVPDLSPNRFRAKVHTLSPYVKATFGPVYVEGEFVYLFGNAREYSSELNTANRTATGWGGYVRAQINLGPAYFGASFGMSTGDDPSTLDKDETGPKSTVHWNPGLLFGDGNYRTWVGGSNLGYANNGASFDATNKSNLLAYNLYGGVNITPKLNIDGQLWILQADTKKYWQAVSATSVQQREALSNNYGTEFDVTATYKIYDNLTYMVGAGYFLTGDYFKGTSSANKVSNDYLFLNKLTLTF